MNAKIGLSQTRWRVPRFCLCNGIRSRRLLALLLFLGTASVHVFAQGKVSLQNSGVSAITLSSWNVSPPDVAVAGQPVGTTGPLPSGIMLYVGLYAGTASTSLSLVSGEIMNPVGGTGQAPGLISPLHIVLPFSGGAMRYFQVKVWDSTYATYEQAMSAGSYLGQNNIFTMTPGTSIAYPPVNSGGGSTWTAVGNDSGLIVGGGGGYPDFIIIYSQPTSQTVLQGHTAGFAVGAYSSRGYPLSYRWRFNGVAIPYADASFYQVTNVQPANAGAYSVFIWDPLISTISAEASLTVLPQPTIFTPPQSQTAEARSSAGFDVVAAGDTPLSYQWFFNATNALGTADTNAHFQLSNIQSNQAGAYSVVVSNTVGAVTSPPAMLQVIAPVERRPVPALKLAGDAGSQLSLGYAQSLAPAVTWLPLDNVTLGSTSQWYFDITAPIAPERFYRAWQTGTPVLRPSLNVPGIVPAITLTGNIGDHLRLDYINQVGPIEAWVTLDTVSLTNTSQLYFDVTAIIQPPRLYRIVPVP